MANLKFIPNVKGTGDSGSMTLDQISDEVKNDVEEVYKALKANPGRMAVEFPSVGELNAYLTQVKAYCELRPIELGGPVYFRRSPTPKLSPKNPNGLKPTQAEFRITDKTENEVATEEIRTAVDNVKDAAKSGK